MANKDTGWIKLFLGLGILAVISGIYFLFQKDYVEGIINSSVGVFLILILQSMKKSKDKNSE